MGQEVTSVSYKREIPHMRNIIFLFVEKEVMVLLLHSSRRKINNGKMPLLSAIILYLKVFLYQD